MARFEDRRAAIERMVPGDDEVLAVIHLLDSTGGLADADLRSSDAVASFRRKHDLDATLELEFESQSWGVVVALTEREVHFFNTHEELGDYSPLLAAPIADVELRYKKVGFPPLRSYRFHITLSDGRFRVGTSQMGMGFTVTAMNDPVAFIEAFGPSAIDLKA